MKDVGEALGWSLERVKEVLEGCNELSGKEGVMRFGVPRFVFLSIIRGVADDLYVG